jgi:hypothetical protein
MHLAACDVAEPELVRVDGHDVHWAACIRSQELIGQDRYEAGQVFDAGSTDAVLPGELSTGAAATDDAEGADGAHSAPSAAETPVEPGAPMAPPVQPSADPEVGAP